MSKFRLPLHRIPFPVAPADAVASTCAAYQGHVLVHQPDERDADRLLGTCASCPAWYLVHGPTGRMWRLPDHDALHDT